MNVDKQIESLVNKAEAATDGREAMMYSQAALNAAHAAQVVTETAMQTEE